MTSILGASVEDNGQYSVMKTADGKYVLILDDQNNISKVKVPITPYSEIEPYDYNITPYAIPYVELDYGKVNVNDFITIFADQCLMFHI